MQTKQERVEPPKFGKHLIESLTTGMYLNPMFVYREYIQNAADQIDVAVKEGIFRKRSDGKIKINVDSENRQILIEDNATGIRKIDVPRFLVDVADSTKNPAMQKGFRGIGRLGGLGYCERLIFETSYKGESTKSIMTMNALALRGIINDISDRADAATVVSLITTIKSAEEESSLHYFRVIMEDVSNQQLLNEDGVKDYLSMVAPVPFRTDFSLKDRIYDYFKVNGFVLEEYDVHLNCQEDPVQKAYSSDVLVKDSKKIGEFIHVDFFRLKNEYDEVTGLCWYGMSNVMNKQLYETNIARGIRLRKNNITIGDENTLKGLFNEDRFNLYFIGEVHVWGTQFVPNARRDNFNDNNSYNLLKEQLREEFKRLEKLARSASDLWSRRRDIENYVQGKKRFEEFRAKPPISEALEESQITQLKGLKKKAESAKSKLATLQKKYSNDANASVLYRAIIKNAHLEVEDLDRERVPQYDGFRLDKQLSLLDDKAREIVLNIFGVLDAELVVLETDRVERLKMKIVENLVSSKA